MKSLLVLAALAFSANGQQYAFVKMEAPFTGAAMIEDDEGAMWIGAEEGLYRFDGARFRQIDVGMGKVEHTIRSLAKSADGSIWATCRKGLMRVRMEDGNPKVTQEREGFSLGVTIHGVFVASVEGDGNGGSLTVGTYRDGRLTMFRYDGFHLSGPPKFASDGSLIAACGDFICELRPSEVERAASGTAPEPKRFELPVKGLGRMAALKDESGCYWFRSGLRAGYRCPSDKQFQFLPLELAEVTQFNSLVLGPGNQIWLVSDAGMLSYGRPGHFRTLTSANGMPRMMEHVYPARDGTVWLTSPSFLWRLVPPDRLEVWSEKNGLSLQALAAKRGGNGEMLIGGLGGLLKLSQDRTKWEPFGDQRELRNVRDVEATRRRTTVVGSTFSGILELDRRGAIVNRIKPSATRFGPAEADGIWTSGMATQFLRFGAGGFSFDDRAKLAIRSGVDLVKDGKNRLWHCNPEGLMRLDPGTTEWKRWTPRDGLIAGDICRAIAVSPSGDEVWFMYQLDEMSKLDFSEGDTPKITHFRGVDDARNGGGHYVLFVRYDKRGRLWRAGGGIRVSDGKNTGPGNWIVFNDLDGFPSTQIEDEVFFADEDGSVWLTTDQNVYHYMPPADLFTKKITPNVFISATPPRELKKGESAKYDFGSLYFEMRNQLRFRYRLHANDAWTETKDTAKTFDKLAPGDYHFELAARVAPAANWTPAVTHEFRVVAPWWQTPTALSLIAGLGICTMAIGWTLGQRKRAYYRKQKKAFLEALDTDRKTTDPEVERLLQLSKTPTHLPDLSPWHDGGGAGPEGAMPTEVDGRFDIDAVVASGGFATVYVARDRRRDGARSAVKIFHLSQHEREWMLKRFSQEIEALKRMDHRNVVHFLEAGETGRGEPYLAMDFVPGETLRRRLADGPLSRQRATEFILQLGAALGAIHQASVYHRDIKPENLMLTPEDRLVVIDFSIAIARDPRSTQHALSRAAGSFLYMAPEQVFGFATPATDIYSFALVVFEMLTGKRAGDLGLGAASGSLPGDVVESLREICPELPTASVLAEALVVEVRSRPQDAVVFAERLAAWLRS